MGGGAKKQKKCEARSGSIRDMTPHIINDSQGLTPPTYVVFHEESRGYDPRSIYPNDELSIFRGRVRLELEAGRG